ncbi:MAG: hypothetical protein WCT14_20175, partial [Treponemataceae bacterium]
KELTAEAARSAEGETKPTYQITTSARIGCGKIISTIKAAARLNDTAQREECTISTKLDFVLRTVNFSISGQTVVDESGKAKWAASIGVAAAVFGGHIMARFGTDEPASWDRITGIMPSASPLGPWNFSLSWRFRERFKTRFLGID